MDGRGPENYTLANIHIGAKMEVFGRQFVITGCDETVRRYLDESGVHLPPICRESIEEFFAHGPSFDSAVEKHVKVPVA